LKEYIHLLPDIDRESRIFESENNLEDTGIHALGALAGEGFFRQDVRFDADEFERDGFFSRTFEESNASATFANRRRVGFIHIDAKLELGNIAEEDGWFGGVNHHVFTGSYIDLENGAVARGADCEKIEADAGVGVF
jgi:hypothetical protein